MQLSTAPAPHYRCPRCATALAAHPLKGRAAFRCATCSGLALNIGVLRAQIRSDVVNTLWRSAGQAALSPACPCPTCTKPTRAVSYKLDTTDLEVDVCMPCQLLWLDHRELETLWSLHARNEPPAAKPRRPMLSSSPYESSRANNVSALDFADLIVEIASAGFDGFS